MNEVIVPTFVTKVTEYLCSGWFFLHTNFDSFTSLFDGFFYHSKGIVVLSLNLERYFTCDHFFLKLWWFKDCHFGHFGTINARYISRYYSVSGDLICLKNPTLYGVYFCNLHFIWRVGGWVLQKSFTKKNSFFCYI